MVDHFTERSKLSKWSPEQQLKAHLTSKAKQAFMMLSPQEKSCYQLAVEALKKRFHPVDIEELRGLEFHQLTQKDQSVEQLGIQLHNLCKKAFPSVEPKGSDRLLKGRFFQALLPKWQRRLGAPKPSETFTDLYDRARTLERHDKQFADSASLREVKPPSSKKTRVTTT